MREQEYLASKVKGSALGCRLMVRKLPSYINHLWYVEASMLLEFLDWTK